VRRIFRISKIDVIVEVRERVMMAATVFLMDAAIFDVIAPRGLFDVGALGGAFQGFSPKMGQL
jgi:hypothetical protein